MRIIISSLHIDSSGGGSGSHTSTLANALKECGHHVTVHKATPEVKWCGDDYDLIISSHTASLDTLIKSRPTPHIHFLHGIYPKEEQPKLHKSGHPQIFAAVSEEVKEWATVRGFSGVEIIRQPHVIETTHGINQSGIKALFIKNAASIETFEECGFTTSDRDKSIREQILQHDVVMGLGRSYLEGVSLGRVGIVNDTRQYQGRCGDGLLLTEEQLIESMRANYSGRASAETYSLDQLKRMLHHIECELDITEYHEMMFEHLFNHHDHLKIARQIESYVP